MERNTVWGRLAVLAVVSVSCSGRDKASVRDAQARSSSTTASTTRGGADGTRPPASRDGEVAAPARPGRGGGGQRPAPTITLAGSDVAYVRRDAIEEGIAVTGDLRPIETVDIRARLEGNLVGVYVREGERVRVGQLLARFDASEQESGRASAEADRVAAQSELSTAQWNLDQTTELFRAGAVAERDYKIAQQAVTTAQARLAAAQSRLRSTNHAMTDTRVLATTSGVIATRMAENGEHVARGTTMFKLVRNDVLELAASVPARQANLVRAGQTVHFSADARAFDGKVARVSPTIDPASRTVSVYVQIPNASGALKGGTFASGRVVSRVVQNAIVVPTAAIRQSADEGKPYVFRLAGRTIDIAPVSLGVIDDRSGAAEVLDGLAEGDRVIVGNVGALGRGMQVIIAGEERSGRHEGDTGSAGAPRQ